MYLALIFTTYKTFFLFYIPYKICKVSLKIIDFIATVYEPFDNPSYAYV